MPALYVYEVEHPAYRQTGVWALTELSDVIKTHELTFDDSVRRLKNYRENTGLEGSPVLLTYAPDRVINEIIVQTKLGHPVARYENAGGNHKLWKIENDADLESLIAAFAKIDQIYMADGHHRKRSAEALLWDQVKNGKHLFATISSLYMSMDELKIRQYNRVFIPELPINKEWLFKELLPHFYIRESLANRPVQPDQERWMGLYIEGVWFNLIAKPNTHANGLAAKMLDVSILQDLILEPLFGVDDPGSDRRLVHIGGEKAIAEMQTIFKPNPNAIGFTLCPITTRQLIEAADNGINLPPKATWIDPKIPYGLLLYKHL
jgi:uncharacterized protein (DUF1015 family)